MGKINWGRVIAGGLLAGVVLNVFDFVVNGWLLSDQWTAAMTALG
ncbi:MAG: magnesium transporter, partial [Gemmatimonadetes bacterium]|nr:magnesium transporter [Gemmatimonadota bacterium]